MSGIRKFKLSLLLAVLIVIVGGFIDFVQSKTTTSSLTTDDDHQNHHQSEVVGGGHDEIEDVGGHTTDNSSSSNGREHHHGGEGEHHGEGIHVWSWRFDFVAVPFILTAFTLAVVSVKIVFHHMTRLWELIPESCVLIVLGLLIGCLFLLDKTEMYHFLEFKNDTFFLYLLPPIILEASYSLNDRAFAENFGTIMLYAVVGTLLNAAFIGLGLYGISLIGGFASIEITLIHALIFSSLISAVDPVAGNIMSYSQPEKNPSDAVTVVLYNVMVSFSKMPNIAATDIALGIAAFFASSIGAVVIGAFFGLLSGFITKYTGKIRVVEPPVVMGIAYLSYLSAELFHFSGIIGIIFCGLVQSHFAMENISSKSYITVHYFSKVMSSITESLIFIILGVMLVKKTEIWHWWSTAFTLYSLALCLIIRFSVVFFLAFIVNTNLAGIRKISIPEQLIMSYGGLRGAVSFSLVFMLDEKNVQSKNTLMCAALIIILFTVFVQGTTIKPLVRMLQIKLESADLKLIDEINHNMIDHLVTGIEEISGHHGEKYFTALTEYLSRKFLRPILQKDPSFSQGKDLLNTYQEITIQSKLSTAGASSANLPVGEALWDELQMVDKSSMPSSFAEIMIDAQDDQIAAERTERRKENHDRDRKESHQHHQRSQNRPQRKGSFSSSTIHGVRSLRNMFNIHKQNDYKAGDRNLLTESKSTDEMKKLTRQGTSSNKARYNKTNNNGRQNPNRGFKAGLIKPGMTPATKLATEDIDLHTIHEVHHSEEVEETNGSEEANNANDVTEASPFVTQPETLGSQASNNPAGSGKRVVFELA